MNQVQLGTAKKNITIMTKPAASATIPPPPPVPAPSSVTSTNLSTLQTSAASSPPPPTTRSRPILPTHQNSLTAVSSSPNTTTTLVPSQVINSVNGNKSQIAYAPAARITTNQITNLESKVESSVLKQGPVAMTSTRTKRQISSSQVTTSSTTLPVASAFSSTTNNNILQASKRVKSSKLGTWR